MVCGLHAADRAEITFADGRIFPESLTSTRNGDLYFGSLGLDSVYRATSSSSQATTWIPPKANGLTTVLGVFADERAGVLWVCASASGGRNGAPYVGETALKAFTLKDASYKASYAFPGNGLCNDIAVAKDGTVYATDTVQARVLRLKKGASALDVWATDTMLLATADGVALLADGNVYVNSVGQGTLLRIDVNKDGSAGKITKLET
jgi:sugar lactone lactonase YvrE